MILRFLAMITLMITLNSSPQNTDFSQKSKPTTLKVLLHKEATDVQLEVKGRHYVYNPMDGTEISWGILSKRFPLKTDPYGIHWGEKYPFFQLRLVPGDSQSSLLINGIQYRGCIEVYLNDGKFNIVNEVDIENYLKSTLSTQFRTPLHEEVINSIAILARTHAYFTSQKNKHAFWHVVAADVGYQGAAIPLQSFVEKAVDSTYHAILTYDNAPFAAAWTPNSAGKTVDFATIFRKAIATPPGVVAPLALKDRDHHLWNHTYPKHLLAQETQLSGIQRIDLYVVPNSEKVYAVKISDDTHTKNYDFATFQNIIGKQKLPSNDFKVKVSGDDVIFTGYGEGIGVGLCLYSATKLADQGLKAPQILETFFPQTKLEKVK